MNLNFQTLTGDNLNSQKLIIDKLNSLNKTETDIQCFIRKFIDETGSELDTLQEIAANVYNSMYIMSVEKYDPVISKKLIDSTKWGFSKKFNTMPKDEIMSGSWLNDESPRQEKLLYNVLPKNSRNTV